MNLAYPLSGRNLRLKTLKIKGFKSFADRVVIDFHSPLIGIVGPNGCGKSNIVDAFRWVLGEQSAKSLRGAQMHDVLFAGSASRGPAHIAEVTVTLTDIEEGELSLPYTEVTITRKLFREGASEYFINQQPVRLRDIQSLFLGTGVGRGAFSIFEQGKIDRIISLPPLMRREIFDEAAGIGRFLERKKETLRKLAAMMENYNRLKDLHAEVDKQTRSLKRQAAAAEQFLEKKQRLEGLEKALLITQLKMGRENGTSNIQKQSALQQQYGSLKEQLVAEDQVSAQLKQSCLLAEQEVSSLQEKVAEATRKAARHEAELEHAQKREQELTTKERSIQAGLTTQIKVLKEGQMTLEAKQAEGSLDEVDEAAVKGLQQAYLGGVQKRGQLQQQIQAKQFGIEKQQEAAKRWHAECGMLTAQKKEQEEATTQQRAKVEALKQAVEADLAILKEVEERLQQCGQRKQEEEAVFTMLGQREAELTTAKKMLLSLKESREGFSEGAKTLLKASQDPKHKLYQTLKPLSAYFAALPAKAHLLDVALQRYRQTLVAETREAFDTVFSYATQKGLKDFSLFCLEDAKEKKKKLTVAKPGTLPSHFLHDVHFGQLEEMIDQKGVLFLSSPLLDAPFAQAEKLTQLEQELKQVAAQLANSELEKLSEQLKTLRAERAARDEQHRRQEMHLVKENFSLQQQERLLKESSERLKMLQKAEPKVDQQLLTELEHLQQDLQEISVKLPELEEQWHEAAGRLQKAIEKKHAVQLAQNALKEARARQARLEEEQKEVEEALALCKALLQRHDPTLSKEGLESIKQSLALAHKQLHELRNKREAQSQQALQLREQIHQLEKQLHAIEIKKSEQQSLEQRLLTELFERFSLSENEAMASDIYLSALTETELEVKQLKRSLEQEGSVNLTAIESYAEQARRFEDLDHQLSDLIAAKQDLEALIAKLDHESRKLFKETFAQIRENFQKNFAVLFGGGEADLRFTDSNDILEAGIDIIAKPPGKHMRSISLLSGGEKCLTALALLFSLFEVKPAPFCILDEVDAPLDESNVGRFTQMLSRYTDKTQFLIVTHNKKTMAASDLLIGVSMEEKGVSKLLSLTFAKSAVTV